METQKLSFLSKRNSYMQESIYKIIITILTSIVAGALVWIADDVTEIKTIVHNERVVVGKMGIDVKNNTKQIIVKYDALHKRISAVEERIITHVIDDAGRSYNTTNIGK